MKYLIQWGLALFFILTYFWSPEALIQSRYYLLAAVLLFIGIPHGAMDHIVDASLESWNPQKLHFGFYGWYLGAIGVYAVFWLWLPLWSFLFFLAITAYHFGQADVRNIALSKSHKMFLALCRGGGIAALLMFADIEFTSGVLAFITPMDWSAWVAQLPDWPWAWLAAALYPLAILSSIGKVPVKVWGRELADGLVIGSLFLFGDVVIAFALYFGVWHSYGHVKEMAHFLSIKESSALDLKSFYQKALNFTLLIYLGLLFLYNMLDAFGQAEKMIALFLAMISVLTLPHLIVVDKMYAYLGKEKKDEL